MRKVESVKTLDVVFMETDEKRPMLLRLLRLTHCTISKGLLMQTGAICYQNVSSIVAIVLQYIVFKPGEQICSYNKIILHTKQNESAHNWNGSNETTRHMFFLKEPPRNIQLTLKTHLLSPQNSATPVHSLFAVLPLDPSHFTGALLHYQARLKDMFGTVLLFLKLTLMRMMILEP